MNILSSLPIFYCEKQSVFFDQVEEHTYKHIPFKKQQIVRKNEIIEKKIRNIRSFHLFFVTL